MKTCTVCKLEKALTEFHKRAASKDGLHYVCKICHKVNVTKWQKDKPAAHKKAMTKYRLHTKEQQNEALKKWAVKNPEKRREQRRRFAAAHPERLLAKCAKRRARKLQAYPDWVDQKAIEQIYKEARRLTEETGIKHHVDHFYPLMGKEVCGLHVEFNLRAIPAVENQRKGNRLV
jgi:hypothetical protein